MSLKKRLFLAIACNIFMLMVACGVGLWGIERLATTQKESLTSDEVLRHQMEADMMHDALRADVLSALYATAENTKGTESKETVLANLADHVKTFQEALETNEKLDLPDEIRQKLEDIKPTLHTYIDSATAVVKTAYENHGEAAAMLPAFTEKFEALETLMGQTSDLIEEIAKKSAEHGLQAAPQAYLWMGVTFAASLFFGLAILMVLNKTVTQAVGALIERLRVTSSQVLSSANQVASSSQALAQGATEQAASLEESAAALEEVSSASKHNTDNSQHAYQLSESVLSAAQEGVRSMTSMTQAISSIKRSADETAQIVKIIDEIAFQTNLLALNAAVEAARAGDAGKGFAVVAEEVRNLAQRSANAAKESSEKITQSKELADNGVKVTEEVAKSLENINENAVKSAELMREIAAASKEQTSGITQVNIAVSELDKVTQQNSAAAEESSASAQELTAQATTLDEVVQHLSGIVYGGSGTPEAPARKTEKWKPKKEAPKTESKHVAYLQPRENNLTGPSPERVNPTQIIPLDDNDFQGF